MSRTGDRRAEWRRSILAHAASAWPTATAGARLPRPGAWWSARGDLTRDHTAVLAALDEIEAGTIVVGLPLSLSGAKRSGGARRPERGAGPAYTARAPRHGSGDGRRALYDRRGATITDRRWPQGPCCPFGDRQCGGHGAPSGLVGQVMTDGPPDRVFDFDAPTAEPPEDTGIRTQAGTAVRRRRHVRRRRRRVLALIASAVVLIVLAFVGWYEVSSHTSGPLGKREIIEVRSGESVGSVVSLLASDHVIGSSLAFRVFDLWHGSPTHRPRALPAVPKPEFLAGACHPGRWPQCADRHDQSGTDAARGGSAGR